MMVDEWGTNYCKNCGHESHCGIKLMRDEYNWKKELLGQIEVCRYCRCVSCEEKTQDPSWPGPGV